MQFDADLLFKDHGEDAQNEDDQGSGLLPDGDAGEIFGGELVVVRADKILVVRQQLIAEHRKIQNAEDEHRQADADVLKEAGLDAKLIERICADEVAGRADDREVAAERGCENERHEELSAREVGGRCDADDDRDQHGGCAGIGQETAHQTRDEHDGDDALALRFGKACDKTADLVRHAGLKERLADDEHGDTEDDVTVDKAGKGRFGVKNACNGQADAYDHCSACEGNLFPDEHHNGKGQEQKGDCARTHKVLLSIQYSLQSEAPVLPLCYLFFTIFAVLCAIRKYRSLLCKAYRGTRENHKISVLLHNHA